MLPLGVDLPSVDAWPPRMALGLEEEMMISECIAYYRSQGLDPGYQGHFENRYCKEFTDFMGGGYADAVATGTAALFVALAALELPRGSEVLVSPITDPGTLSAIILNGLKPRCMDSAPNSYNVDDEQFEKRLTCQTKAAVIVHSIGEAAPIDSIQAVASKKGVMIVEDCSQAHGALCKSKPVGSFGDIAALSTMYRKAHITGGSGGIVYTKNEHLYRLAIAHADRGKPTWKDDFDERDPTGYLFPALNLNSNEISCAIGIASLKRLRTSIAARQVFVKILSEKILQHSRVCRPYDKCLDGSPFIFPIFVDESLLVCDKATFASALRAAGVGLNPHYKYLVRDWLWLQPYLSDAFETKNARSVIDRTFCLYLNENYGEFEADQIVNAIVKVEETFL